MYDRTAWTKRLAILLVQDISLYQLNSQDVQAGLLLIVPLSSLSYTDVLCSNSRTGLERLVQETGELIHRH